MSIVDRVRNILTRPKIEWPLIAAEPATVQGIYSSYAVILALLPVLGTLLGVLLWAYGLGLGYILVPALVSYVIGLAMLYVIALIADVLAPSFDGVRGQVSAVKLVVYSATPVWIAGFFAFLGRLGSLIMLIGFVYAAYLLYLGAIAVMKVPEAKAPGYTAVVIILWLVLWMVIVGALVGMFVGAFVGGMALSGPFAG